MDARPRSVAGKSGVGAGGGRWVRVGTGRVTLAGFCGRIHYLLRLYSNYKAISS